MKMAQIRLFSNKEEEPKIKETLTEEAEAHVETQAPQE
jgi:hypothetical protein